MSTASEEQLAGEVDEAPVPEAQPPVEDAMQQPGEETPPAAQFDELGAQEAGTPADEVELDVILDVPVTLALEVGRTRMTIRDLLRLNQGSVVELDRPADQPMDVLVNGTLVAHAEIVVVDDMFGIRLIDVVSPTERIRNLR